MINKKNNNITFIINIGLIRLLLILMLHILTSMHNVSVNLGKFHWTSLRRPRLLRKKKVPDGRQLALGDCS